MKKIYLTPCKEFKTLFFILFVLFSFLDANAVVKTWNGGSGNWNTNGNWLPVGVPGAADDVIINSAGAITINRVSGTIRSLSINNGTVTLQSNVYNILTVTNGTTIAVTRTLLLSNNLDLVTSTITVIGTFDPQGQNFTCNGATSVIGVFNDSNNPGVNTFIGAVTVNAGGAFTATTVTTAANMIFQGGISNGNTFNAGAATFSSTQNINGTAALSFGGTVNLSGAVTVTNNTTVSITGVLDGTAAASAWVNANGSTLNYGNATQPMNTGALTASTCTNTVNYNGATNQAVKPTNYCNLSISNSTATAYTKTLTIVSTWTVNNLLSVQGTGTGTAIFAVAGAGTLSVSNASIGQNGQFNKTTVPTATTAFNTSSGFTGKFDWIGASNNAGTRVTSTTGTDLTFVRGDFGNAPAGSAYAVRNTDFSPGVNALMVKFNMSVIAPAAQAGAGSLIIGDGFANNNTVHAATIHPLLVNLLAGNQFRLAYGATTSGTFSGNQSVMIVANNSAGDYPYVSPTGAVQTVGVNSVDVWIGTTNFVNEAPVASTTMAMNNLKFVFNNSAAGGTTVSSVTLNNMQVFPGISGVINTYTPVTAIDASQTTLTVGSTTGFYAGDRIIIMQMKGATINTANTAAYGTITSYGNAGNYEVGYVSSVSATTVQLTKPLLTSYTTTFPVQLIRVPVYSQVATVTGLVTATPWNGSIGGVVAIEVNGLLTLNDDIDVSGMGFRGGSVSNNFAGFNIPVNCANPTYSSSSANFGQKGEGIATDATYGYARAPIANGGGGGNPHNSGGGGGSNSGFGATGARQWDCISEGNGQYISCVNSPISSSAGGDELNGGIGGRALDYSSAEGRKRVFMGGGGGGGQQNNGTGTNGTNGGGIVIILATQLDGNNNSILANGADNMLMAGNDSGGGGGAGGSVLLSIDSYTTDPLTVSAEGGKGGDVSFSSCHGNGGGGGGGLIRSKTVLPANITKQTDGGESSQNDGTSDCALAGNPYYCATPAGAGGAILDDLVVLPVTLVSFSAAPSERRVILKWVTSSEQDNQKFIVEKSIDGFTFVPVATVRGKGNSRSLNSYQAVDPTPGAGINYYRLRQVDFSGVATYSKVETVHFSAPGALSLNLYPNPTKGELFLQVLKAYQSLRVYMFDAVGRQVNVRLVQVQESEYRLEMESTDVLAAGVYIIRVQTEDGISTHKVVVE